MPEPAQKSWHLNPELDDIVQCLNDDGLNIHPVLCRLLAQRSVTTYEEARTFFRPSYDHLHDPFLMKDMEQAVERVVRAIEQNERILVYGDYDVDGTTSVSLMSAFLSKVHTKIEHYIPDRYKEGYGVSIAGIDWAASKEVDLIICLDCGIKAKEKVAYAASKNIDFVICDHHEAPDELPQASAVLDPKRRDCKYPYKELSGCGIGFKLCQAIAGRLNIPFSEIEPLLDLVVISIASDIVPITGENRLLAHFGLKRLNSNPRTGIAALIFAADLKKSINITDIVFGIGPRINAAGRLGNAMDAVDLLLSENAEISALKASKLNVRNDDRKRIDKHITEEALMLIDQDAGNDLRKTSVLFKPEWHKGVIGIVASRIMDYHYKPTIMLTESEGMATGSARSVRDFDIHQAISECSDLLTNFGGHKFAAGLTMPIENVQKFQKRFEEVVADTIQAESLSPRLTIDSELMLSDITPTFFNILQQFAPFGPGNMRPVFLSKQVRDSGRSKIVGSDHLKISVNQNGSALFDGIGFGLKRKFPEVAKKSFDVCYTLGINEWMGNKTIQLQLKDVRS